MLPSGDLGWGEMQVPFVGFNVVKQAECMASHGVFLGIQVLALPTKVAQNPFRQDRDPPSIAMSICVERVNLHLSWRIFLLTR